MLFRMRPSAWQFEKKAQKSKTNICGEAQKGKKQLERRETYLSLQLKYAVSDWIYFYKIVLSNT